MTLILSHPPNPYPAKLFTNINENLILTAKNHKICCIFVLYCENKVIHGKVDKWKIGKNDVGSAYIFISGRIS
jgi:hypothetical protein